jgi:hypothetical protein
MPRSTSHSVALIAARYELVRELRLESETIDWEAFDTALDRRVVIQLIRPELVHDQPATERFWQAARAAARRTATVGERVLDAGTDPETNQRFVVREWPVSSPLTAEVPDRPVRSPARTARPRSSLGAAAHWRWQLGGVPRWLVVCCVVVLLTVSVAAMKPAVEGWLAWVNAPFARQDRSFGLAPPVAVPASGAQPGQSAPPAAAAPATIASAARSGSAPTVAPTRAATATPVLEGQSRRVVNTDGRGVALRATPGGDRLPGKGYDEGATVQALEQSAEWTRIRGGDGREGWVLTVTLAP